MPVKTKKAGTTAKHAGTKKHTATRKHNPSAHKAHVHATAKPATHAKAKGLALGEMVACCTTEALAASLRCQGLTVTDSGVLDLFRLAGGDEDRGLPIREALEAASAFGLAGFRPERLHQLPVELAPELDATFGAFSEGIGAPFLQRGQFHPSSLILGLELPGPHAVLATPDGWWSWGGLWCPCEFPDAVVDEAWAVEWAVAA